MKKFSWRTYSLMAFGLAIGVANVSFANHSWGGYHWARTSNPFVLKVNDNVTSQWEPYVSEAQSDWNQSSVLDINVILQNPLSSVRKCSSVAGQIEICNERYGQNGWLGIAGISISGSHITKAYTKLNDTYFEMATYNTPAYRRLVTCQELAHDFGLAHQDENFSNANLGTCMDYTNDPSTNQHPNQHDYDELVTIYSHLDSTTTVGQAVANSAAAADEEDEPENWGVAGVTKAEPPLA